MRLINQAVQVTYHYSVYFTADLFAPRNPLLVDVVQTNGADWPQKILCVIDGSVAFHHRDLIDAIDAYCQHHRDTLSLTCSPLVVEGGERIKNDDGSLALVQAAINAQGMCRHSFVMAIGGGAVLDAVGYAAATAHRGVRLIRVPTTVLAQNDSGVGVKNGVNAFGKKNFLGTFAPPAAVLNDSRFLTTLSTRDWRSGISEAIKVALLKDGTFFAAIEEQADRLVRRDMSAMEDLIYRCAQLHLEHIATSGDPFEFGSARPLDFGHWAAHKIEHLSGYTVRHGEAVAIGIALDSTYSYLVGLLPERDWRRILDLFLACGLAIYAPELVRHLDDGDDTRCILRGLGEFREHLGGQLTVTLLESIGRGREVHTVDEEMMKRSIGLLQAYQTGHTDVTMLEVRQ